MNDGPATNTTPNNDHLWYPFVDCYNKLPFKRNGGQKVKEKEVNSGFITKGIFASTTLDGNRVTLRVAFNKSMKFLIGQPLLDQLKVYGWTYHLSENDRLLFRKVSDPTQITNPDEYAIEFIAIFLLLGVDPNQDWGC